MTEAIIGIDLGNDKIRVSMFKLSKDREPKKILVFDNRIGFKDNKCCFEKDAKYIVCFYLINVTEDLQTRLTKTQERL